MIKTRSHWTHREPRLTSKIILKMLTVLIVWCLMFIISGCANMQKAYVTAPHIPIPEELTAETPQPEIPVPLTWRGGLVLSAEALGALAQCNADKRNIRLIEDKRAAQ